ncbi:hypothetical protein L596_015337 [Steinernema carpocapsae]|uniref:Peptidase S1 domain-containing protein n=1 Tax=Steinernema carpocapsae TaxID=34508 RepID=A0A4U5NFP1_STECR|nr:hypothetical protein L596_015337 [Steinernema carpocapsae]
MDAPVILSAEGLVVAVDYSTTPSFNFSAANSAGRVEASFRRVSYQADLRRIARTRKQHGDSGGPLFIVYNGDWAQLGVASISTADDNNDMFPDAYTRVSKYCGFISEATRQTYRCF